MRAPFAVLLAAALVAGCGGDEQPATPPAAAPPSSSPADEAAGAPPSRPSASPACSRPVPVAGSSASARAVRAWAEAVNETCSAGRVAYEPSNSPEGLRRFAEGDVPLAFSEVLPTPEEQAAADRRCPGGQAVTLPVSTAAIAVAHNVPRVSNLRLGPAALTGIFRGAITRWDAAEIAADNPGVRLPDLGITVFSRSDASGTTEGFDRYLAGGARDTWDFPRSRTWVAPGSRGVAGTESLAAAIRRTPGAIGYLAAPAASAADLRTASIRVGLSWVGPTRRATAAALRAATLTGVGSDLELEPAYHAETERTYPPALVTYAVTCSAGLPADDAATVKSFVLHAVSEQGQRQLSSAGYVPLTDEVQQRVLQGVAGLA